MLPGVGVYSCLLHGQRFELSATGVAPEVGCLQSKDCASPAYHAQLMLMYCLKTLRAVSGRGF